MLKAPMVHSFRLAPADRRSRRAGLSTAAAQCATRLQPARDTNRSDRLLFAGAGDLLDALLHRVEARVEPLEVLAHARHTLRQLRTLKREVVVGDLVRARVGFGDVLYAAVHILPAAHDDAAPLVGGVGARREAQELLLLLHAQQVQVREQVFALAQQDAVVALDVLGAHAAVAKKLPGGGHLPLRVRDGALEVRDHLAALLLQQAQPARQQRLLAAELPQAAGDVRLSHAKMPQRRSARGDVGTRANGLL